MGQTGTIGSKFKVAWLAVLRKMGLTAAYDFNMRRLANKTPFSFDFILIGPKALTDGLTQQQLLHCLQAAISTLGKSFPSNDLIIYRDWSEHEGNAIDGRGHRKIDWQYLENIASGSTPLDSQTTRDHAVYWAVFNKAHDFLLRFYVTGGNEAFCQFNVAANQAVLAEIESSLLGLDVVLERQHCKKYFDDMDVTASNLVNKRI